MPGPLTISPISATTRICAVLGHPIRHSASPAMHNAAYAVLGLDWRYIACDVRPEELKSAIQGAASLHLIGLNLTVPHKLLALEMVDVLDPSARNWGAVNTIRLEGEGREGWQPMREFVDELPRRVRTHGFNTDAEAIVRSIQEDLQMTIRGAKILLLGAGGAGRVAALKFAAEGCRELFLVNRTASKAEEISKELRERYPSVHVEVGYPNKDIDVVVNATSAGLKPNDPLPFDANKFSLRNAKAAYDMIYRPALTPFLSEAHEARCNAANGLGMLLYQGAAAFEIWSGKTAPIDVMRNALKQAIYG